MNSVSSTAAEPVPARPLRRVVVFTSQRSHSVHKGLVTLIESFPRVEWFLIEQMPERNWRRLIRNQWRNVRRNGWRWIPFQFRDLAARLRTRTVPRIEAMPGSAYRLETLRALPGLRILTVPDMHAADCLRAVREFGADLGISLAAPILRPELFELPRLGTINLHKGRLPEYRGMPPAFWEVYHDEQSVGCSIHRVERGLDTGALLLTGEVRRCAHSSVRGLQLQLDELGIRLTCDAVRQLEASTAHWTVQRSGGSTFTKPTLRQQAELAERLAPPSGDPWARRLAKEAVFRVYLFLVCPTARLLRALRGRQRVVVLLYHRVNDDMRDAVTVGIEQFERQMAWLGAHCDVVRIEDVLAGRINRHGRRPIVAVTFDDGYADNHHVAAPILERLRIPAAFFVSTGRVGQTIGFEHDLEKIGHAVPTMTWVEIEDLHRRGFTIGSHTVTHIDCGTADRDTIRRELGESREALRARLGIDAPIFAYPFGGRHNMTPAVRGVVRELGFSGCLSAYGGCNDGAIDPFDVLRVGISHAFSFAAFRARAEGWG